MLLIVMGVTGCGKSTIGQMLAARLGLAFHDADAYHPEANRAKMAQNIPLGDEDRQPWLEQLAALAAQWERGGGAVLACSALKQAYRALLVTQVAEHRFVYLELSRAGVAKRLEARRGQHEFVGDFDRLLEGQFRDLEPPEDAMTISAELTPPEIVERAIEALSS